MTGDLLIMTVFGSIGIAIFGLFFGLVYKGIDRKIVAHMQKRVGPPIRQPFLDVIKLMNKETVLPENAVGWMYSMAPLVCLASSIILLLYIPMGGLDQVFENGALLGGHGDIILVLYLLIIPSLAMVAGGFASGSPFATVGAQREMVTMMSYEFPLAVVIIAIVWKLSTAGGDVFSLSLIAGNPIWNSVGLLGLIGAFILLLALVIVTPGEVAKIPFDVAEAETEIAHGLLAEYSGRNLALFYLADGVKTFAMASLVIVLFFPYNISPVLEQYVALGDFTILADFLFFLLKVFLVLLFSVTLVRAGMARLRITQVVSVYWITVTLIALFGLVLLMWDNQFDVGWF
ncbi:MAG: NADH-quinone oxidoreductase subunit H [Thermoplasmata archaeon]|nr:MAG: NADH-quinone oxidoreductase subunit H [Thermoplasmata archaeon]RLF61552.1 MAG: NADH-quinone oxidoreductase subunit H [Thermoplasmata archaeon]